MKNINFVLAHMYHFKYFIPLVIEANKRGIKSSFYTFFEKEKDLEDLKSVINHPYKHLDDINKLSKAYDFNFELRNVKDNNISGLTFFGERRGISNLLNNNKTYKVVLTCMSEFAERNFYDWYVDKVDAIVFASQFIAKHYKKTSNKNYYLGSPKYDVALDKKEISKKYNIPIGKNVLILFPEICTLQDIDLKNVYSIVKNMGYQIIVKGRQKQQAPKELRGDIYFDDFSWFPHPTMELVEISDLVISFDSGVSKECIMASVPHLNIHITKTRTLPLEFLYNYACCRNIGAKFDNVTVKNVISQLTTNDLAKEFEKCRREQWFERGNASKKILDLFYEKT